MKEIKEFRNTKGYVWTVTNYGKIYKMLKSTGETVEVKSKQINGYKYMNFCNKDGSHILIGVHRIVAKEFCPIPEGYDIKDLQVDHINNNKTDNRASNLRWVTRKQNNSRLHARRMKRINAACESHADEYLEIAFTDGTIKVFDTFKEAAQFIGCSKNFLYIVAKHQGGHTKKFDLKLVKRTIFDQKYIEDISTLTQKGECNETREDNA